VGVGELVGDPPRERPAVRVLPVVSVGLAVLASGLLAIHLDVPPFYDNEGRYAEVAREMLLRGDYLTPYMDGTLFLNKPPLAFWLTACVFRIAGLTEGARLVPLVAAAVTLIATARLGALLYGEAAGVVAGLALATSIGFVLEARTLRPDMLVTASVAVAFLFWRTATARGGGRTMWLCGMYAVLGLGVLAKGLVPVIVVGLPIALVTLREPGWRAVGELRPGLGLAVMAAIVLPWHVAIAVAHPGFVWDYVVNQHLLFFLGRKPTQDSVGDPLLAFWGAAVFRAIPWLLLVPLTGGEARRGASHAAAAAERATFFLWTWVGGVMVLLSCTPERLEHYAIPTLPALALLAARAWERLREGTSGRHAWAVLRGAGAALAGVGLIGVVYGRGLLGRRYWLGQAAGLEALLLPAALTLAIGGGMLALAAVRRHASMLVGVLTVTMVPLSAIVLRAQADVAPLFSWRPVAEVIRARVSAATEVVFESPVEYQLVGGLAFYSGRRITLLEPPGFTPPTYLARQGGSIFLDRAEFERRWRAGVPLVLVSDPLKRRDVPDGIAPGPFTVLARFGDRWVLTNAPVLAPG